MQGHVILARGFAEIGNEVVIADRQDEVVSAGDSVLLLPHATALDQFAARYARERPRTRYVGTMGLLLAKARAHRRRSVSGEGQGQGKKREQPL